MVACSGSLLIAIIFGLRLVMLIDKISIFSLYQSILQDSHFQLMRSVAIFVFSF